MGSERQGLQDHHLALCDEVVSIPMAGNSDSLNLAVATAVVLYEILTRGETVMIATLEGEVIGLGDSFMVVRVGGVGLQVYVTTPFRARLPVWEHIFICIRTWSCAKTCWLCTGLRPSRNGNTSTCFWGQWSWAAHGRWSTFGTPVDAIRRAVLSEQSEIFAEFRGLESECAENTAASAGEDNGRWA